jgi:polyisoprenoid-binding protein YceI
MLIYIFRLCSYLVALLILPLAAHAHNWTLNTELSSIGFVSTKKENIAENHLFTRFSGDITNNKATITIIPDSIESGIGIRNDRMKEFLFKTTLYPKITVSADAQVLKSLSINQPIKIEVPANLSLHGTTKDINLNLLVTKNSDASISMISTKPVIIRAEDYGLTDGIIKLANLVGDIPITKAVPTHFSLVFNHM